MVGNNYWYTYKRIEKEILEISHSIYIDDDQLSVYSNEILDLIVRININIESVYQDIYRKEFQESNDGIGQKINKIVEKFFLEDKVIYISNDNFHFKESTKIITPFKYGKKDEHNFYSTYNALKHDRSKNIKKANIETLLRSLSAFYILCVIHDDKLIPLQNIIHGNKIPKTFTYNSEIITGKVYDKQLAYTNQTILLLAIKIDSEKKSKFSCTTDLLNQCEKNLGIEFREQNAKECLFMAELTPEYQQHLERFKKRYKNSKEAVNIKSNLLSVDNNDENFLNKLGIDDLDTLIDHIKLNLNNNITNIVVNRDDGSDMFLLNI